MAKSRKKKSKTERRGTATATATADPDDDGVGYANGTANGWRPAFLGRYFAVTPAVAIVIRRALEAMRGRIGLVAIVGDAGSGKSALARFLTAGLTDAGHAVGFLPCSSSFTNAEFLALAATALGLPPQPSRIETLRALRHKLATRTEIHGRNILVLDDAHLVASRETLCDLSFVRARMPRRGRSDQFVHPQRPTEEDLPPEATPSPPAPGTMFAFGDASLEAAMLEVMPPYRADEHPIRIPPLALDDAINLINGFCQAEHLGEKLFDRDSGLPIVEASAAACGLTGTTDPDGRGPVSHVGPIVRMLDTIAPRLVAAKNAGTDLDASFVRAMLESNTPPPAIQTTTTSTSKTAAKKSAATAKKKKSAKKKSSGKSTS